MWKIQNLGGGSDLTVEFYLFFLTDSLIYWFVVFFIFRLQTCKLDKTFSVQCLKISVCFNDLWYILLALHDQSKENCKKDCHPQQNVPGELMRCTNVQMSQPLSPTYLKSILTIFTPQLSLSWGHEDAASWEANTDTELNQIDISTNVFFCSEDRYSFNWFYSCLFNFQFCQYIC